MLLSYLTWTLTGSRRQGLKIHCFSLGIQRLVYGYSSCMKDTSALKPHQPLTLFAKVSTVFTIGLLACAVSPQTHLHVYSEDAHLSLARYGRGWCSSMQAYQGPSDSLTSHHLGFQLHSSSETPRPPVGPGMVSLGKQILFIS